MKNDAHLRKQLVEGLDGGHAHATFEQVVKDFPPDKIGVRPPGLPRSAWELLEHLRLAQDDILRFSRSADYQAMKWPDDYWPSSPAPKSKRAWADSIRQFGEDQAQFAAMLNDSKRDLYEPFPWGEGQTLLREALLIIDHNAWHLGQLMLVRRALEK